MIDGITGSLIGRCDVIPFWQGYVWCAQREQTLNGTDWEVRNDHTKRPGNGGPGYRGKSGRVRPHPAAAPFRRRWADTVRCPRPDAATGVALIRPALARTGRRVPLRALERGDRGRERRS